MSRLSIFLRQLLVFLLLYPTEALLKLTCELSTVYVRILMYHLAGAYNYMLNKNTWGEKKCGANQKQHSKQAGATKRFDIS